ncbi:MAG: HAD family hydrolase, partial [Proteobacteria bacterium]|nr:HAD family hydrolase [Pseudomonadota bacterium]
MFEAAKPHGEEVARKLVEYHKKNGGISRFEKFRYLFGTLLERENYEAEMKRALVHFAELSKEGIMKAPEADGLRDLLGLINADDGRAFVVSGGMQEEIRDVFKVRGLAPFFTGI